MKWVVLNDPSTVIPDGSEVAEKKMVYEELRQQYEEVVAVETSIKNQIIDAVESDYLEALRDETTDMILEDIPEIMVYLN